MTHGGKRPGAGRKPGSCTKKTRAIAEGAAAEGIMPLEFMLAVMRDPSVDMNLRADMAKASAPFVHPRLSTTQLKGDPETGAGITVQIMRFSRPMAC
jgi:hypothetical protein